MILSKSRCWRVWGSTVKRWLTTCSLCLLLLRTTDGLTVYPGPVVNAEKGSTTELGCHLSENELRIPPATLSHCTLSWYRVITSRRDQVTRSALSQEEDPDVTMSLWPGPDKMPHEAVITIKNMKANLEGKYFCSLVCSGHVQASDTVTLLMDTESLWHWRDRGTIIATIISVVVIGCLFIGALALALKDTCGKAVRRSSSDIMSNSSSGILGENSSDSDWLYDPPPRYSLVVVTDEEGNPRTELSAKGDGSKGGSTQSLVWFNLPPPNYQEALKILRNNGIKHKHKDLPSSKPPPYQTVELAPPPIIGL